MSEPQKQRAKAPPPLPFIWETVKYVNGELGSGLDLARSKLRKEAKALGLVVKTWTQATTIVVGSVTRENGTEEDGTKRYASIATCEITVLAEVAPVGPERWVRLTTEAGPCAVEVLTTEAGKVVKREEYHQEDARTVALGYAEEALQASAGGGGR